MDELLLEPELALELPDAESDFVAGAALVSVFDDESEVELDSVELSLDLLAEPDDELLDEEPPVRLSFL